MAKKNKAIKKAGGFLGEFKQFALRGNVIDLAVGVIIGGAFQKIINSVINDLIMPFVGLLTGGTNFTDKYVVLKYPKDIVVEYATLTEATEAGATTFNYGAFITEVVNFIILAFVIFLMVKGINRLAERNKKAEEVAAPTTKVCPFCCSEISIEATRCPHCTSALEEKAE